MSADVVWLRDDFRLDDQPAVAAAADRPALFVYVHDEQTARTAGRWAARRSGVSPNP